MEMISGSNHKNAKGIKFSPARFFPEGLVVYIRNLVEGSYEIEMDLIRQRLPEGNGYVLDIGVGTGETIMAIPGSRLVGIETDEIPLRLAAAKGHGDFVRGDAESLPFRDGSFSAVLICKTGHHLDERKLAAVSAETHRVLTPGGRLIFLDPVPPSKKTTLAHKVIASIEIGSHHREFDDSAVFFNNFNFQSVENFRKRGFDFYIAVFEKP